MESAAMNRTRRNIERDRGRQVPVALFLFDAAAAEGIAWTPRQCVSGRVAGGLAGPAA